MDDAPARLPEAVSAGPVHRSGYNADRGGYNAATGSAVDTKASPPGDVENGRARCVKMPRQGLPNCPLLATLVGYSGRRRVPSRGHFERRRIRLESRLDVRHDKQHPTAKAVLRAASGISAQL